MRAAWHFERMTPLAGREAGLRDWLAMFGSSFFTRFDASEREAIVSEVEDAVRAPLYFDGQWHVDYRRLRFVAVRTLDTGAATSERV